MPPSKYSEHSRWRVKTRKIVGSSRLRTPVRYGSSRREGSRRSQSRRSESRQESSSRDLRASSSRKRSHSRTADYRDVPRKRINYSENKTFDVMEIPYNVVPFVIGVHKHRIKDIQHESGCEIHVLKDITSKGTTLCNFFGRPSNIETARAMINKIIKLYPNASVEKDAKKLDAWKVIKIPANKCGFIVGENGKVLKKLQQKHGVEMKVVCQRENLLHITGPVGSVDAAYAEVEKIIGAISSTTLVVPRDAIGPIMGHCGQNLMWFSSKSGCKIILQPLDDSNSNEQSAICTGTADQIAHAIHMISKLLHHCSNDLKEYSGYFHVGFEELEDICKDKQM